MTTTTLKEILLVETTRPRVVEDCVQLVDSEVASKRGIAGLAVKGAYALVKKIRSGIIRDVVDGLLDEFVERAEPFYAEFLGQKARPLEPYLTGRSEEVANALLGVTDGRAEKTTSRVIKKAYVKLRPTGLKHTAAAVPGLARLISKYLPHA
ncbi:DUF6918 family protein [Planctomycetota bacterium]